MRPIWWAVGTAVLVLILIVVGWSVRGSGGDGPAPDVALGGTLTPTAQVDTQGPAAVTGPAVTEVVNGTPGAGPVSIGGTTIGDVVWTSAVDPATQAPAESLDTIPSNAAEMYAALPLTSVAAGTVIGAAWSYNGVPLDALSSSVTASVAATNTWVAFRLGRIDSGTPMPRSESDWPDGDYGVVITVDGQVVQEGTVTVDEAF